MAERRDIVALYGVPEKVEHCTRCVVSNQRPRITFDQDGVCSACLYADYKQNVVDWDSRLEELAALCDRYRHDDGSYDVVVPCSGGKDGGRVAWMLKHQFGMHPLTVTWSPHVYSDVGWRNLQSFIASGFDHILLTPDGQIHRRLTRIAFEEMGDPFQPFIFGQYSAPFRVAAQNGVRLVFYGEDGEVEYGGSMESADRPNLPWDRFVEHRFSGIHVERFLSAGITEKDIKRYTLSDQELSRIQDNGISQYFMSYFIKWTPQENYYAAVNNFGFEANEFGRSEGTYSKYASLDDKLDGFHYYLAYIKFGIGRATSDAAHEVRDGHISREEAVALVRKYDGEFPKRYFEDFLEYCDMGEDRFWEVVDSWRGLHLWDKIDGEWKLQQKVQ